MRRALLRPDNFHCCAPWQSKRKPMNTQWTLAIGEFTYLEGLLLRHALRIDSGLNGLVAMTPICNSCPKSVGRSGQLRTIRLFEFRYSRTHAGDIDTRHVSSEAVLSLAVSEFLFPGSRRPANSWHGLRDLHPRFQACERTQRLRAKWRYCVSRGLLFSRARCARMDCHHLRVCEAHCMCHRHQSFCRVALQQMQGPRLQD